MKTYIKTLANKAADAKTSVEALQFSQSSNNVANAFAVLSNTKSESLELWAPHIKHMVTRFLGWKLPANFSPDAGISFKAEFNEHTDWPMKHEPSGTNLFDAKQTEAMVRYLIDGMPTGAD